MRREWPSTELEKGRRNVGVNAYDFLAKAKLLEGLSQQSLTL